MPDLQKKRKIDIAAIVFAVITCGLYVLGLVAYDRVIAEEKAIGRTELAVILIAAVPIGFIVYGIVKWLYGRIDRAASGAVPAPDKSEIRRKAIKYFIIIFCAWLPYMVIRYAGNYDPDTWWQLLMPYGYIIKTDHHPWFDTCIYYVFWRLGDMLGSNRWSMLLYGLLQMLLTAGTFAGALGYMLHRKVPGRVVTWTAVFFAAYPVIPLFAQTMTKDMTHSWIFVLFFLFYIEIIYTRGNVLRRWGTAVSFAVICILMFLTKKPGIYIVVPALVIALFVCRRNRIRTLCFAAGALALFLLYSKLFLPAIGVQPGPDKELLSVPSQQIAYYIRTGSDELSAEDWEILRKVYYDPEEMGDVYVPVRADHTKDKWINNNDSTGEFLKWYARFAVNHPKTALLATAALDYPLLAVDTVAQKDESLIFYRDNVRQDDGVGTGYENGFAGFISKYAPDEQTAEKYANAEEMHRFMGTSYRPAVMKKVSQGFDKVLFTIMDIVPVLFSKVLFATWIPLFALLYGFRKKSARMIISLVPIILNTAVLAVGPVVLPRYMVLSVYTAPFVIMLMFVSVNSGDSGPVSERQLSPR